MIWYNTLKKNKNYMIICKLLLFIAFALISLYIASTHELWRDEAQSWLMSRDMGIIELIKNAPSEGHPILWHIILKIFVFFRCSYEKMYLLPWALTLIGAFVFIWDFPANFFTKIIFLCTYPLLYFCPSYLRSYSLMLPLFVIISDMYKKRYDHSIIYGLLLLLFCNIHVISAFIVGLIFLIELYEFYRKRDNKRDRLIIILLCLLGFILLIFQLYTSNESYLKINFLRFIISLIYIISGTLEPSIIDIFMSISVILYGFTLLKYKEYKMLFVYVIGIIFIAFVNALAYLSLYINELYLLVLMFTYWNINKSSRQIKVIFLIIISLHAFKNIFIVYDEVNTLSSDSKNVSIFIKENIPRNSVIYCEDAAICSAIIPYLNNEYQFIDVYTNKQFTFVKWNEFYDDNITNMGDINCEYYITMKKNKPQIDNYEIIYETTDEIIWDEEYCVLKKTNY